MAGRSASGAVTRYAGIQVQTSSLGLQIPVGWGTFRCRCNLVDYLDFKSSAQKAASGKGGSTTTGYNYSATVILAICEGQIDNPGGVTQVWVDGKQYAYGSNGSGVPNTANASALSQAGLTLNWGAIGQPVWSYLTTAHANHAIGYSGLAIAYAKDYPLDSSASTPSHSFEVVRTTGFTISGYTGPDVDPSLVIADFFQNPRTGVPGWPSSGLLDSLSLTTAANSYQKYCLAAGLLLSPIIDQQRSASDALTEWLLATNSTAVWSEGLLKFVPYGDTALSGNGVTYTPDNTPIYSLGDDDYIVKKDGDPPLTADIMDQSDAYNVVQLEYLDRTNQYNMAIALASDAANVAQYGMRRKDPDTVHCVCTPSVAAIAAQLWLQRTLYIRAQYKFRLSWAFALLEPGDLLELTDSGLGLSAYMVRIIQVDEDEKDGTLDVTCEDYPIGVGGAPLYSMQNAQATQINQGVDPGGVEANLLLWSRDWTNAAWSKTNLTVTAAAATDPVYGQTIAQKLLPTTANGVHDTSPASAVAIFSGANYTFTQYFAGDGYSKVTLDLTDGSSNSAQASFDLSAGTVIATAISGTATVVSATITPMILSGWYRCQITAFLASTIIYPSTYVLGASGVSSFAGDGTSAVLAFGAQLTQGVDARVYAPSTAAPLGPIIFNPPAILTPGNVETWAAVAGGPNWGGADVWLSFDNATYAFIGTISNGSARFGYLTASFPSHADPDTADTLSVDLGASGGTIDNAATAAADAGATLSLVDSELITYSATANPAANVFTASTYIRRGFENTTIPATAHSAGAPFIRLDSSIFQFPYLAAQAGKTAYVKFQSFNLWGQGATPLTHCIAYSCVPVPAGARAPGSGTWTAIGTSLANSGQSIPAIQITGASDNPSATSIEFLYRPTGTSAWINGGLASNSATQFFITGVQSSQTYDVAVAYIVGGVVSGQQTIATSITVGQVATGPSGGGGGATPGSTLLSDSASGSGKTFTVPAGSYAHVDIVLTGFPGKGGGYNTGGGKGGAFVDLGGGGGMVVVVKGFPVTPGSTSFTYTLPTGVGSNATCTASGLSLTATPGTDVSGVSEGVGGSTSGISNSATGAASVTNYAGHNGGLTDTWDGGGPGATINVSSGTVTTPGPDNTSDGSAGTIPGQGGAGTWITSQGGGGCNILIIARA